MNKAKCSKDRSSMQISSADKATFLSRIPLFKGLGQKELDKLACISQVKDYPKDHVIIKEGATGNSLYVIMSGSVKICMTAKEHKTKTLAILEKNDFFGEMALIDKALRSASCIAMAECELLVVSRKDFEKMLKASSPLAFVIFKTFSARLREADKQIETLTFQNVLGRLAVTLLDLAKRYGKQTSSGILITKEFTHQDLADMVGTAREMISRILNNFRSNKCIETKGGGILITNRKKLLRWVY